MAEYTGGTQLHRLISKETGKAPFTRVMVEPAGPMAVVRVFTSRPDTFQARRTPDLLNELQEALRRSVTVEVTSEARAVAKYVRVPPLKAQRVMKTIRGKYVDEALALLRFMPNRAARHIEKVLKSAAANAEEGWGAQPDELRVSIITASAGPTMKRIQPRAMGRAYRILKRTSHLEVAVQQAPQRARRGKQIRRTRRAEVRRAGR